MNNSVSIFRSLHQTSKTLILPNAWDAASARIFEEMGASAIATTSAGVAWSLGYPDGGIIPVKAQAQVAENITRVINVPLSVDFENGYSGNANQVAENIRLLLDAGIAGINIEDGTDSPASLALKIEAIRKIANSYGSDLFINARTDVYLASLVPEAQRVEEVAMRSKLYAEAGGSGLFVPFLASEQEIADIVSLISLPLNVLSIPALPDAERLARLGVKRLSAGSAISLIIWQQAATLAKKFLTDGDSSLLNRGEMTYARLQGLFTGELPGK